MSVTVRVALALSVAGAAFLVGCSGVQKKSNVSSVPVPPPKLPKPAPMRVAADTNLKRRPPALPTTVVNIKLDDTVPPSGINDDKSDTKIVDSTTPKFINNEQPEDFFQGAGDGPAGEAVLGSFFDQVFRPAVPMNQSANQPVSSTTYTQQ